MKTPQIPAMPGMSPLGCRAYIKMDKDHAEIVLRNRRHYSADTINRAEQFLNLLNPLATDQKTIAERQWQKPKLAPAPQRPCDVGLFSDDTNQLDLLTGEK